MVIIRALVFKVSHLGNYLKTMRKTRGHVNLNLVLRRQKHGRHLSELGRGRINVHDHIEDLSTNHPHQFSLGVIPLKMESTQDTSAGTRMIVLHERQIDSRLFPVSLRLEGLQKESALISKNTRFDEDDS